MPPVRSHYLHYVNNPRVLSFPRRKLKGPEKGRGHQRQREGENSLNWTGKSEFVGMFKRVISKKVQDVVQLFVRKRQGKKSSVIKRGGRSGTRCNRWVFRTVTNVQ